MKIYKIAVITILFSAITNVLDGQTIIDTRLLSLIQNKIDSPWPNPESTNPETRKWGLPTYALAALYMNQDIQTANDYINAWYVEFPVKHEATIEKNADFKLNMFWRMYLHPATSPRLNADTRDNIEDMMWRWIDKRSKLTDAQASTWNYHGSENHDAMEKVGYLMCAQALKDAGAPYGPNLSLADGGTLAEHTAAWTNYFRHYFRDRAGEGINAEIACPGYAKYTMGTYHNLRDFSESAELRMLAEKFINLYWTDTAVDWVLSGVRGGGETRCYKENNLRTGAVYSFSDILYAYGWKSDHGTLHPAGLHIATSTYRVPDIITAIATDTKRPNYLYTSRRWGLTTLGNVDGVNYVAFDNGNSHLLRETWVTPDYAMGSLTFNMNKDYLQIIDQNRAMGVMFASGLDDRVMVCGKGATDDNKSYADLSGVTREDCMVVQRDKNANNGGNGTLIFVPASLWNNRIETNGWLFLQAGNAYCGVKPAGGGYTSNSASRGYDLELGDLWAPVIIQTGQASNYAGFADFQTSVMANTLTYTSGTMNYTSEAGDTFTFYANTRTTPKVNGTTVNLNPAKTYDSPYLSMVHGEDTATVSYPGYQDLLIPFTLQAPAEGEEYVMICRGEEYKGWKEPGTYKSSFISSSGNDSILTTHLTVASFKPTIVMNGNTLSSNEDYAAYQWYYSAGPIPGATNPDYKIKWSGEYYLEATSAAGCTFRSDTTFYQLLTSSGHIEIEKFAWTIMPNPGNGIFNFRFDSNPPKKVSLKLINSLGQIIEQREIKNPAVNQIEYFDVSYLSRGVYHLIISDEKNKSSQKIITL